MADAIYAVPPRNTTQAAYASGVQAAVSASVVYGLSGFSSNVVAQYIQIHDAASAPTNGAAPKFNMYVPAGSNFSIDFGIYGMDFQNGVYVCNSTTSQTLTAGAADCQFFVRSKITV